MHSPRPDRRQRRLHVDPRGREQGLPEGPGPEGGGRLPPQPGLRRDPPHQAVAVGMHAPRGEPEQHVALDHALGQGGAALHRPDREPRQIEIPGGVESRHLRRLAPYQRRARLDAAFGDPPDDGGGLGHLQLARREVVEEEQRLRPLADQVVHAHRDEVDPHRVEPPGLDGELELGADPVGRGHQHRILVTGGAQVEQRPEPAEAGHDPGAVRAPGGGLDPLHQRIAGGDVHASVGIAEALGLFGHRRLPVEMAGCSSASGGGWEPACPPPAPGVARSPGACSSTVRAERS